MPRGADFGRRLVEFSRKEFGGHLTSFLLSGRGETEKVTTRSYLATWVGRNGEAQSRIRMVTAHPGGLPKGDHPLVLLALLKLALERGLSRTGHLEYGHGDVYDLLGWEASEAAQGVVDEAVHRYFQLNYEVESRDAKSRVHLTCSLVPGCASFDDSMEGVTPFKRLYRDVRFSSELLKELKAGKLFHIDWRRMRDIKELTGKP